MMINFFVCALSSILLTRNHVHTRISFHGFDGKLMKKAKLFRCTEGMVGCTVVCAEKKM